MRLPMRQCQFALVVTLSTLPHAGDGGQQTPTGAKTMTSTVSVTTIGTQQPLSFKEENISGLILLDSEFSSATVGFVEPQTAQTPHFHNRPKGGEELIFVYQGRFRLVTAEGEREFDVSKTGPVFIRVPSGTEASLANTGTERVTFFSVFSPPFTMGEIQFLQPKRK